MKLDGAKAGAALDRLDPAIRLILFSGADASASRLLAQRLLAASGAEKVAVSGAQLKADPAWLADEAASLPMFGGRRLIWIEPAGEDILPAVEALLALPAAEAPAAALAPGALRKESALGKALEKHPAALHVISEPRAPRALVGDVLELGRGEGLRIPPALAERIAQEAGCDLMLVRLELQKFALYLGASPEAPVDLDEEAVDSLGIDQSEAVMGRAGDLALSGDLTGLATELSLMDGAGFDAVPVIRALQRRLLMLAPLRARIEAGQRADTVLASVWKRDKSVAGRILPRWSAESIAQALLRVQQLERDIMLRPIPPSAALGETLVQLARVAASRR